MAYEIFDETKGHFEQTGEVEDRTVTSRVLFKGAVRSRMEM